MEMDNTTLKLIIDRLDKQGNVTTLYSCGRSLLAGDTWGDLPQDELQEKVRKLIEDAHKRRGRDGQRRIETS